MDPSHNLPPERTRFVGRARELAELSRLLGRRARLVTLTGPAGAGKTRLALRLAADERARYEAHGGAWLCDLSHARDPDDVARQVAGALGLPLGADSDAIEQLGCALASRGRTLLVLDGFRHGAELGRATLGRFLALAPEADLLITARAALALDDEVAIEVGPLDEAEAEALFAIRAAELSPGWVLEGGERAAVQEILSRLGRLPLSVELAAARAPAISPSGLLERLPARIEHSRPDVPRPGAAARGAIRWSWAELPPRERDALAQCAVFRGGLTVEAAEAVLDVGAADGAPPLRDVLWSLLERHLVVSVRAPAFPAEPRFRLEASVLEFAGERLAESGRLEAVEARHAAYYLGVAEGWARHAFGADAMASLARLAVETDNLVAAHQRALERDPATAVRAVLALDALLGLRGPYGTRLALLDGAAEAAARSGEPGLRARVLERRGEALHVAGRFEEAEGDLEEALAQAHRAGDRLVEAEALRTMGVVLREQGRFEEAVPYLEDANGLFRELGERRLQGMLLGNLGTLHRHRGQHGAARSCYERALAIHREVGNRRSEGIALGNLGHVDAARGDLPQARARYQEALPLLREVWDRRSEGIVLGHLGHLLAQLGDPAAAIAHYDQAAAVLRAAGDARQEGLFREHARALRDGGRPA